MNFCVNICFANYTEMCICFRLIRVYYTRSFLAFVNTISVQTIKTFYRRSNTNKFKWNTYMFFFFSVYFFANKTKIVKTQRLNIKSCTYIYLLLNCLSRKTSSYVGISIGYILVFKKYEAQVYIPPFKNQL